MDKQMKKTTKIVGNFMMLVAALVFMAFDVVLLIFEGLGKTSSALVIFTIFILIFIAFVSMVNIINLRLKK